MSKIIWIAVLLLVGAYVTGPILDPDIWWHITVGRWILAHYWVPTTDYWNTFSIGQPWVAYSWSSEILYALIEKLFGIRGLLSLKLALAMLLTFSLFYTLGKISRSWSFGAMFGTFAAAATFNHLTLRPQLVVWILLVWLLYLLELLITKKKIDSLIITIGGLMVIWANNHITTALGLLTIACWLYGRVPRRLLMKLLGISFVATLVTPYLGQEWLVFLLKSGHPLGHQAIAEFSPAQLLHHSTAFLVIIAAILFLFVQETMSKNDLPRIGLCVLFSLMGIAAVKFLPFAVITITFQIASMWGRERRPEKTFGHFGEGLLHFEKLINRAPRDGLAFICLCIAVVEVWGLYSAPINESVVPRHAVDFIVEKRLAGPIMNEFGQGGYLIYRFSDSTGKPRELVSIDGRTNVNPPEIWEQYLKSYRGLPGWDEYLRSVKPETILWRTESPLTSILLEVEDWCRVFASGSAEHGYSVFVKRRYFEEHQAELGLKSCIFRLS